MLALSRTYDTLNSACEAFLKARGTTARRISINARRSLFFGRGLCLNRCLDRPVLEVAEAYDQWESCHDMRFRRGTQLYVTWRDEFLHERVFEGWVVDVDEGDGTARMPHVARVYYPDDEDLKSCHWRDLSQDDLFYEDDKSCHWHDFNHDGCTAIVGAPAPHTLLATGPDGAL